MDFDITRLFDAFNTQDSYNVLIFMLVSFLLGLLLAYIMRGATIRRLRKELRKEKKMVAEARADFEQSKSQFDLNTAKLNKANFELGEAQAQLVDLENEKNGYVNQVYGLNTRIEELQSGQASYGATIESLNEEIDLLKAAATDQEEQSTRLVALEAENATLRQEIADLNIALAAKGTVTTEDRSAAIAPPVAMGASQQSDVIARLELMESKLRQLENENSDLRSSIGTFEDGADYNMAMAENAGTTTRGADTAGVPTVEEDPELHIGADKSVLGIVPPELIDNRDDLTQIEGLGTFLQQKLYDEGIYTYDAIAGLSSAEIDDLTKKIGYLPGRIEKDDWVGQAKKLMGGSGKATKKSAKKTSGKKKKVKADDLKIIEGVGPKIESLLKDAGIKTLNQLAQTPVDDIKAVLTAAGDRYRMHDPGTWPSQARLAANEEWELLKQYQDDLDGGRAN